MLEELQEEIQGTADKYLKNFEHNRLNLKQLKILISEILQHEARREKEINETPGGEETEMWTLHRGDRWAWASRPQPGHTPGGPSEASGKLFRGAVSHTGIAHRPTSVVLKYREKSSGPQVKIIEGQAVGLRAALCEFCRDMSRGSRKNLPSNLKRVPGRTSAWRSEPDANDSYSGDTGCGQFGGLSWEEMHRIYNSF